MVRDEDPSSTAPMEGGRWSMETNINDPTEKRERREK